MNGAPGDWFERVPKAELHLHLEGAIPPGALWEILKKHGGDPSVPDPQALRRRFAYRDFRHFIETWIWMTGFLRDCDDFAFLAEAVSRDLLRQGIRYAEVHFSAPAYLILHGLEVQKSIAAVRAGLSRVPGIEIGLIVDLVRGRPGERASRTLAEAHEVKDLGVLGIGLGGLERDYPPERYEPVFREARRLGFRTTAHAGEDAGATSIWGALRSLQVERIGHGTRAFEDERLLDHLRERQVPLEMCPLSNVRTGVVPGLREHPVADYFRRGLLVTVNTDDPALFGNSLAEEYRLLETELGFSRDDIRTVILNTLRASWLEEGRKRRLIEAFRSDPGWT